MASVLRLSLGFTVRDADAYYSMWCSRRPIARRCATPCERLGFLNESLARKRAVGDHSLVTPRRRRAGAASKRRGLGQAAGWAHRRPAGEAHAGTWRTFGISGASCAGHRLKKHHCRAYEVRGDAGMERRDYATCETSFETKSRDEDLAGVGCRGSVSVISGGRIRND